jgi:hypothetical protein
VGSGEAGTIETVNGTSVDTIETGTGLSVVLTTVTGPDGGTWAAPSATTGNKSASATAMQCFGLPGFMVSPFSKDRLITLAIAKRARGRTPAAPGQDVGQFLKALKRLLPAGANGFDDAYYRAPVPSRSAVDPHDIAFCAHGHPAFFTA